MYLYPKIKDLEAFLVLLKLPEIVATEKIHGGNLRIHLPPGIRSVKEIHYASKGALIRPGNSRYPLLPTVERILGLEKVVNSLPEPEHSWTLCGELYGPDIQQEIPYRREGIGVLLFDVARNDALLPYDAYRDFCSALHLPTAPELYRGEPAMEMFGHLVHQPSALSSAVPREGIVIRDPSLTPIDGHLPLAKFKNEPFREKDYSFAVEDFRRLADEEEKARRFARHFVTGVRLHKMATVLEEAGRLTRTGKDIPALIDLMINDIQVEDRAYYDILNPALAGRIISEKVNEIYTSAGGHRK